MKNPTENEEPNDGAPVRRGVGHGHLFKRGAKWCGCWMWHGKRYFRTLGAFEGSRTPRADAQAALDEAMRPYRARTDAETAAHLAARASVAAEVVAADEARRPALRIDAAFEAYALHPRRPRRATKDGGSAMLEQYRSRFARFERWISDRFPDVVELRAVSRDMAYSFLADLEKEVGANTYNKHVTFLSSVWEVLADAARLPVNPWRDVNKRPQPKSVRRELSGDELARIAETARGEMWLLFAVGIYTGLRMGDAVRLEWCAVDFAHNHITVEPTKTERFTKGAPVLIPMVPQFRAILEQVPTRARKGRLCPALAAKYEREGASGLSKDVQKVFADCGIETQGGRDGGKLARVVVGFHSLRHTFVSIAAQSGIPFSTVQAIVGHSSPAMTRHYLHVSETAMQADIGKFPHVFGGDAVAALPDASDAGAVIDAEAVEGADGSADAVDVSTVAKVCAAVRGFELAGRLRVIGACAHGFTAADFAAARRVLARAQARAKSAQGTEKNGSGKGGSDV